MKPHSLCLLLLCILFVPIVAMAQNSPWDPAKIHMVSRELAPGVFGVFADDVDKKDHTGTNAGFVVGRNGVLVIESLVNGTLASELLGEIRKHTTLPIRYLVNTSYHGDHSYGNFLFPAETTIISHAKTKEFIDTKFEQDRKFMLGLMGVGRGIEEVVPRSADVTLSESLSVDLGGRRIEILHIGFAQTPGDLIIWLPEEKIVFVGNMIQAPPPAIPWLLEGRAQESIRTLQRLHDMLDDQAVIVTGHGRPMHRQDILYSIEYLTDLERQIATAREQRLTLEQVQKRVTMPAYSRYSLFNFAHFQVNIPAVYGEISTGKP